MATPMRILRASGSPMKAAPANLPITAASRNSSEKLQMKAELQSISRRFSDSPTMTKKIGVNSWMIGRISVSMRSEKRGSLCRAMPNGRKKRRDSASPAAKPPSSSGAPISCASQANSSTSETMAVGIRPGVSATSSKRLTSTEISRAATGASRKKRVMNISTRAMLISVMPPPMENS